MGEGEMWGPKTGWGQAIDVLYAHGLNPIQLEAKEGISLINGTQFITALGSEALHRASNIANQADVVAALSIDALKGTPRAFDRDIHLLRPHRGQQLVAARLRALLDSNVHPSQIRESHRGCTRVQDPYTMRCVPQVHGVVHDTIEFVSNILTTEMNSATDNPVVLANREEIISGGNFHGEYPAKAMDYLAISIHEIANMSERRLERMVHPAYSELPAFLIKNGGLNSGFMLAQVTAAALVSENKVLTHPSSVDSITTSAGTEDHVSMGGFAARKAINIVEHVEQVVAIELLAACQSLEFHRPKQTTAPLEEVYKLVRSVVRVWDKDRFMAPDIAAVTGLLQQGKIWQAVAPYITAYEDTVSSSTCNN
jgi:histidine ammonia-lyase